MFAVTIQVGRGKNKKEVEIYGVRGVEFDEDRDLAVYFDRQALDIFNHGAFLPLDGVYFIDKQRHPAIIRVRQSDISISKTDAEFFDIAY